MTALSMLWFLATGATVLVQTPNVNALVYTMTWPVLLTLVSLYSTILQQELVSAELWAKWCSIYKQNFLCPIKAFFFLFHYLLTCTKPQQSHFIFQLVMALFYPSCCYIIITITFLKCQMLIFLHKILTLGTIHLLSSNSLHTIFSNPLMFRQCLFSCPFVWPIK